MLNRRFAAMIGAAAIGAVCALPAFADDDVVAKTQVCGLCHGQDGTPIGPTIPVIWGQQQNYLVKELHDFRSEDRINPIMAPVAAAIKQEDTRPIAAYFASKPWPANKSPGAGPAPEVADKLDMCQACHQPGFIGGIQAPRLAGLNYQYLVTSMRAFASDQRTNNGDMPKFMKALTDGERAQMAKYLAGL